MAINEELFAVKELEAKMKKYDDKRKALQEVRLEGALIYSPEQKEEYEAKRKVLEEVSNLSKLPSTILGMPSPNLTNASGAIFWTTLS